MEKEKNVIKSSMNDKKFIKKSRFGMICDNSTFYKTNIDHLLDKHMKTLKQFLNENNLDKSIIEQNIWNENNIWWEKSRNYNVQKTNLQETTDNQKLVKIKKIINTHTDTDTDYIKYLEKKVRELSNERDTLTYDIIKKNEILQISKKKILDLMKENELLKMDPEILKKRISVDPYGEENWND